MQTHVDRPTAVANALAAAQTDTFEEEHPGPDLLKLENTARNRVKREFKRDKMRNLWLQRLYDGTFFIAWHVFEAVAQRIEAVAKRNLPTFGGPIRPYSGGELNANAISQLVVELSCALCTICNAIFDAACAVCSAPSGLPTAQQPQPLPAPIGTPVQQPQPLPTPIGTPVQQKQPASNVSA